MNVRNQDQNLKQRIASYLASQRGHSTLQKYHMTPDHVQPVKVVAHMPNGERLIGVRDTASNKVVLCDKTAYKK